MAFPKIDMVATGRRIALLMRAKGFCVRDIQHYLGLSAPQAIYKWLWGKSLPSIDNLYALGGLLGTPLDDILVGQGYNGNLSCTTPRVYRSKGDAVAYYYLCL